LKDLDDQDLMEFAFGVVGKILMRRILMELFGKIWISECGIY
jgi:hypothetical protein